VNEGVVGKLWHNDGPQGKEDPNNSLNILLEWLSTEPNLVNWRGNQKEVQGKPKDYFAKKILEIIKSKGIAPVTIFIREDLRRHIGSS